jgi:GTP-binding protein
MKKKNTTNSLPIIALVGRPNVGKSTLMNRLAGKKKAITHNQPGVTRDCRMITVDFYGMALSLMDTPGLLGPDTHHILDHDITSHTLEQLKKADMIAFIIDGKEGINALDQELCKIILRFNTPKVLLINKCDTKNIDEWSLDPYQLGIKDIIKISAEFGDGLTDFAHYLRDLEAVKNHTHHLELVSSTNEIDMVVSSLPQKPISLTVIGRPNVGKSTLVNKLLGQEVQLVADFSGVTRDSTSYPFFYHDTHFELIDTAGLRRPSNVTDILERLSIESTNHAIRFGDVVVLLMDGLSIIKEGLSKQDLTLASYIEKEGRAIVLAVNKIDVLTNVDQVKKKISQDITQHLHQLAKITPIFISSQHGTGLDALMKEVGSTYHLWNKRVATHKLNTWLQEVIQSYPPPIVSGKRIRLKYMTQIKSRPPTFSISCTKAHDIPISYKRFLINRLRQDFGFGAVPIRLLLNQQYNPYVEKKNK